MTRKYSCRDFQLIVAAQAILESFLLYKEAFTAKFPRLVDPFADQLKALIENVLTTCFGINSKEQLKITTALVNQQQRAAKECLTFVKTQIKVEFSEKPARKKFLLDKLGFQAYGREVSQNYQEATIACLLAFDNNMDDEIRQELVENNVNPEYLDNIQTMAAELHAANVTQESLKGTSKIKTGEAVAAFNAVYKDIMDICYYGKLLFRNDRLKKDLFVFGKVVKNQTTPSENNPEEE